MPSRPSFRIATDLGFTRDRHFRSKSATADLVGGKSGIHSHRSANMDSGLVAEPVIGPRDFARARWLGPGMTAASTRATRIAMANFMSHVAVPIAIGAVAIVLLLGL